MKLKKSTQILLAAAVLVGGGVIFYETIAVPEKEAAEERQQDIFTFESEQVESITVDTAEKTLKFDRLEPEPDAIASQPRWQFQVLELKVSASETEVNKFATKPLSEANTETKPPTDEDNTEAESPDNEEETDSDEVETGASWLSDIDGEAIEDTENEEETDSDEVEAENTWLSDIDSETTGETETEDIEIPLDTPVAANVAYVDYLLSFLTNEQSDREINIPTEQLNAYGLEPPQTTIDITLDNGETHQLNLGNRDFSGQFFYAIVDPQTETAADTETEKEKTTLLLVSSRLENAIDRPLSEWKEPLPATATGKTWQKE